MIKFFRHLRQRLVKENKFSKYLLYAIGEIILVVIGILIAVQINTWNEQRKEERNIEVTKIALTKELQKNLRIANRFLQTGYELSDVLLEIKTKGTLKKIENSGSFYGDFGLFDTFVRELESDILTEFIQLEKSLSATDGEVLEVAKRIKKGVAERSIWEAKATDLSLQRFKEFSDELPWFYDTDSVSNRLRNNYIKNDPFFKTKAIHYLNFQLNENVFYASEIRNNVLILLWKLENTGAKAMPLSEFLANAKLKNFKQFDCSANAKQQAEFIGFRNMFLIYNQTREKVELRLYNENHIVKNEIILNPNQYVSLPFYDNYYIQQGIACEKKYRPVRNGFLILK